MRNHSDFLICVGSDADCLPIRETRHQGFSTDRRVSWHFFVWRKNDRQHPSLDLGKKGDAREDDDQGLYILLVLLAARPGVEMRVVFLPLSLYHGATAAATYRNKCAVDMTSHIRTLLHDRPSL